MKAIADMIDNILGTGTRNGYIGDDLESVACCRTHRANWLVNRRVQRRIRRASKEEILKGLVLGELHIAIVVPVPVSVVDRITPQGFML
jgi:hypothetical protein